MYTKVIVIFGTVLISSCFPVSGQNKYVHFTEIEGLPQNITTCLEQDNYGYLWIGTGNGIARYDGEIFSTYPELEGFRINYLLYDKQNRLWVASEKGLHKYNRRTNYFERIVEGYITKLVEDNGSVYFLMVSTLYRIEGNKPVAVYQGDDLTDFCFSREGIWYSSSIHGAGLLSRESGFTKTTGSWLKNIEVANIERIDEKIFAGCYNGQLFVISTEGRATPVELDNQYFFMEIIKVGGEIWLATDGNGIIILNKDLKYLRTMLRSDKTNESLNSNSIYDILPGNNQEIWIATYGAGLTCILPDNKLFQNLLPEKGNMNSLVANEGVSVYIRDTMLYFGTNYGLSAWNPQTGSFKNLSGERLKQELKGSKVTALQVDQNDNIWVGTYDGLLGKYSPDYQLLKVFHPSSESPGEMQQIVQLKEIDEKHMLVLTQFHSRILLNFNKESETAQVFELLRKGSNNTYCLLHALRENRQGELVAIISDQGLFHVNLEENILENRLTVMNSRISSYITDFYHDRAGNYWIASSDNGLLRVSEDGKTRKQWTMKNGLPSNILVRIESEDDRFLWISSQSGICRFDMDTEEVLNYNHRDGLPANEFQERVSAKLNDGRIVFGSLAGFTLIDPAKVNSDTSKIEIVISDIRFQNQSIRSPGGKQYLDQALEETKMIKLPYTRNSFSLHFFVKNKSFLKYHSYAYRLVGLENQWTYLWDNNYASYTNLSPGTYTFEVKSAEGANTGKSTRLIIQILSPWYLSWYAYISYAIIFFILLSLSVYAYLKRMELKKEKEISEFKIQKEHELTEKKLEFFTNISHDLKTPLTLIDAPLEDLLQADNLLPGQVDKLNLIRRNSRRLYSLLTDLLDFRKLTRNQYTLAVKETDISSLLKGISEAFKGECEKKSIEFRQSVEEDLLGYVDAEKVRKVLWNLLSNAVKYTDTGGQIGLSAAGVITNEGRNLELLIKDNGIGIAKDDLDNIFNRFYKSRHHQKSNKQGTGIGLSIVKELVGMHHGTVQVESELKSGSTFSVCIPINRINYTDNELVANIEMTDYREYSREIIEDTLQAQVTESISRHYNKPGILVVEDNPDLRHYLAGHLESRYKVYQAEDGSIGTDIAREQNPDIILTDIEMPTMNGYEFCNAIRNNFDTSHIPIVMLTAKDTIDQQIEGISRGADAYLTKPFDVKLLDTVLNSLLESRMKLRNKFSGLETSENIEKAIPQKDIDFITGLKGYIQENMINPDLNVEILSDNFAVSMAQLNRKIKALTGLTPNNLIKSIRLRTAYKLIKEDGLRVSEAAYQTGFSDPNYFTTCFKKEFGQNPSQIG
ncbi:MAG: response regulator [Bacteroidales bacterium]|nr:response regulator [Bacteroidales bacterium]